MAAYSIFSNIITDPPIEVFELTKQFSEDKDPSKVNLGVGGSFQFEFNKFSLDGF